MAGLSVPMAVLSIPILALSFGSIPSIIYVALGLGLVIFFHELGHFAVAKWCNVYVEKFSIGFGPVLWSFRYGETEYALSAIPFGGFVKMLGQDDMDPSQLSSEDLARDPRSYSAKSVPQRMAIISAGVIMNILTAVIFFGLAFGVGITQLPSIVGGVQVGKPAWVAGIREGDRITEINGREIDSFGDIMRGVALSSGPIKIKVVRANGNTEDLTIVPDKTGNTRRIIGVAPAYSLTLTQRGDASYRPVMPGSAAAEAKPELKANDTIRSVDGTEVTTHAEFQKILAEKRAEPIELEVSRPTADKKTETLKVTVPANPFRTLGLWMDIGRVVTVEDGSPAFDAGLKIDDKITRIGDKALGTDINPLMLPDYLASLHGKEVEITVSRQVKGGGETKEFTLPRVVPVNRPGWVEFPMTEDAPLSVPALGVAFHIVPTVLYVEPGSAAEEAKIVKGERIRGLELVRAEGGPTDLYTDKTITIGQMKKDENSPKKEFYAYAFWKMQELPSRDVILSVSSDTGTGIREVPVKPRPEKDWFSPRRGFDFDQLTMVRQADSLGQAFVMGMTHTRNSIIDIYLTLRSVITGDVSWRELHGPVMIAKVAYYAARQGLAELSLFLGLLSVNLAVINFLPIPVLDGGHMVFLIWEAVTRKRPSERVLITAQWFGLVFVLSLMALVLFLDLFVHTAKGQ